MVNIRSRDRGFTLIELLVVVMVLSTLSAISVPVFVRHRANAKADAVRSDAQQAGLALTAQVTGSGILPSALDAQGSAIWGFKASPNNTVAEYIVSGDRFRICIVNATASPTLWAIYASATEKVTTGSGTEPTGACDGNTSGPALAAEPVRGPSTPLPTPTPTAVPTVTPPDGYKCHLFSSAPGATDKENLSWAAASNANGYRVKSYRDGVLQTTVTVTGTSTVVDDPAPGTWQWTVDARGPGFTGPCAAPAYTPPPDAPTGVTASAFRGESRATISWAAVSAATSYQVYLDGAATPAWTGTALTATLSGMTSGTKSVTVSAKNGTVESPKSTSVSFTVVNNDNYADAAPLGYQYSNATSISSDFSNATATIESSEVQGRARSLWWYFTAQYTGVYTLRAGSSSSGSQLSDPLIDIWRVSGQPSAANPTPPSVAANPYSRDTATRTDSASGAVNGSAQISATAGNTYAVRVTSTTSSSVGRHTVTLGVGSNDHLADPLYLYTTNFYNLGEKAQGSNLNGVLHSLEPGENTTGHHTSWYRMLNPSVNNGDYMCFRAVNSSGGIYTNMHFRAFRSAATTHGALPLPVSVATGDYIAVPAVVNGGEYRISVGFPSGRAPLNFYLSYFRSPTAASCAPGGPYG